jgi:adenosine deaminase
LETHREQAQQGAEYVELRFSPRRFLTHGLDWDVLISTVHSVLEACRAPLMRAIILVNRDSPEAFVLECCERIANGLPHTYVGLDVAGDETRYPATPHLSDLFLVARSAGLGITVHAGEFGHVDNVWQAIDEFGAVRLGHAVGAAGSPALLSRLARDQILVELSITTNRTLGSVAPGVPHPIRRLVERDVAISLNTDVPLYTGCTLEDEYRCAEEELGIDRDSVLGIQRRAYSYAFGDPPAAAPSCASAVAGRTQPSCPTAPAGTTGHPETGIVAGPAARAG